MPEAFLISTALSPLTLVREPGAGAARSAPPSTALEAVVLKEALEAAGLDRRRVDAVYWSGSGPERLALQEQGWGAVIGVEAGELSAQAAVHAAAQAVAAGDVDVALAGGSASPLSFTASTRRELRLKAEAFAAQHGLTRLELDEAVRRAAGPAGEAGAAETLSMLDGAPVESELTPVEDQRIQGGMIGAGVLPGDLLPLSTGAGAVLVASSKAVGAFNLMPRGGVLVRALDGSRGETGWDGLVPATRRLLTRASAEVDATIDLIRIGASFVGVEAAWLREFPIDVAHLLPMGAFFGAATGIVGLIGLLRALEERGSRLGLMLGVDAAGPAAATLIERI